MSRGKPPVVLSAAFYNNTYFAAYQNYEDDNRNRIFGNAALNYQVTDWLNIMGRVAVDYYSMFEEERVAVTSVGVPYYTRTNSSSKELNYDLLATETTSSGENFKTQRANGHQYPQRLFLQHLPNHQRGTDRSRSL